VANVHEDSGNFSWRILARFRFFSFGVLSIGQKNAAVFAVQFRSDASETRMDIG